MSRKGRPTEAPIKSNVSVISNRRSFNRCACVASHFKKCVSVEPMMVQMRLKRREFPAVSPSQTWANIPMA